MSGFLISWAAWVFIVAPFFGLPFDAGASFGITVFFTFLSLSRTYVIRRFFNGNFHKMAVNLVRQYYGTKK